jgi:pimeloyl-ACP methyl ester carboxylesterase
MVGSGGRGLALPGGNPQLVRVRHLTGAERTAANVTNLSRLMIADPARIDDLAVEIQDWNTGHSRLRNPDIARSQSLQDALSKLQVKLNVIYGDRDAAAYPRIAERKQVFQRLCPTVVDFRFVAGAGHWLIYEAAAKFHEMLLDMMQKP